MPGDASVGAAQSIVIVVPREKSDLGRALSQSFGADPSVQVVVDRRTTERRVHANGHALERRRGERRRPDGDKELLAGRWIAVSRFAAPVDFLDLDARAILRLCCEDHLVPCQGCQDTYRIGWLPRGETGQFPCPRCGGDLTPTLRAHAQTCRYWAGHRNGGAQVSVQESA
jgi:hypothetical protein